MIERIRESLVLKWMIFSIFLAAVPLAIGGFSIIEIYQRDLKRSVIGIEEMKADRIVDKTEAFFERVVSNLLFLARDESMKEAVYSHARTHLENLLYQNDYLVELTLLDEKGKERVKVSKNKVFIPSDLASQSKSEMFGMASKGRIYYGDFYLTPDAVPSMVIAVPAGKYGGETVGVLSAKIHLRYLWNLIPQSQIGKKGSTYVVDRKGDLIAHPDTRRVLLGLNVRHLPMVNQVVLEKEGNLEFEYSGEKFLGLYKPIKALGWGVVVQVPVQEAYQPIRQVARHAVKWIAIVLTLAVILSILLTRRLTLPIKDLSTEMGKVAKGDLDIHIQPATRDELGRLTESFNRMIQDVKESHRALQETEKKYRMIFENSKDMVYLTAADGKFVDVNQAGIEMLGYEGKADLLQTSPRDIYFNIEDRKRFWEEMIRKGFVKDFEVKFKRKDGTPIDALITANSRKDEAGETIGYEGFVKDISDRKRMEEELIRRTGEIEALYSLSVLINETLYLDRLLPIALEKALSLTGFEMGSIHLLSEDGETLELKSDRGQPPALSENVSLLKVGEGVAGKVIRSRRPAIISIDDYPTSRIAPLLKEEGVQTLVGIPLLAKEKAVGTLTLLSRSFVDLTQQEINLLESIGNQIGLALENARLFSTVTKAKSEWETTFDAVTDLITIRDKDYRIVRANKAAFQRFGLKPEQVIGKGCFEIFYQSHQPCEGCYISNTLETKRVESGERDSKYLNGVFQYYTFPIFDEDGKITAVVDLAREITEQKRLEKEKEVLNNVNRILASSLDVRQVMKAVHSELRRVLDSARMTMVLFNEAGGFAYYAFERDSENGGLVGSVRYPREGTPFEKVVDTGLPLIVPDTTQSDSWLDRRVLEEGMLSILVFPLEYRGRVIGAMNFGSRERNHFSENHVRFLRQVAAGLAISTQNSLLLDEIKESEEKYRIVVEGAHDGVLVLDLDHRIKYVNQRLAEISGYSRDELLGSDFRDYLNEENRPFVMDRYLRLQRGEDVPARYELNLVNKAGAIRNMEVGSSIVKDSRGNVNTIAFLKDITERKKMEEQLLQSEKLRALGEMASGVAHDFNNALAIILGNAQLLLYNAKDRELRESLQTIEKVTLDSAQTVRRLQDFTRERITRELHSVDLNAVVKDAIEITRPKWKDEAQRKGVLIEVVPVFGEISPVTGNASELREVITNMIFNSIEAMPEGGRIEIRTFERKAMGHVQLSDTGVGMTEEVKKKIFEPFFTTKPFSNTGLGLSMSYGIIKRLGGQIEVESQVGKGTTFTFSLPMGMEEGVSAVSPPLTVRTEQARILVIDDEEEVRSILAKLLSQVNHRVTVAENGEEGIRLFREGEFDMVLTDLGMPGLSGWDVCKCIKEIFPDFPVGMITGWGMELDETKIKESGIDFVISKPFNFEEIVRVVGERIESRTKGFYT